MPHSLGLGAYIDRLNTPLPEDTGLSNDENGQLEVLAVHKVQGIVHALLDWDHHRVPSWQPADTLHHQPLPVDDLVDHEDLLLGESGFYTMYAEDLRAIPCCEGCTSNKRGLDPRLYIDASLLGNVRYSYYRFQRFSTYTVYIQHTRFIVSTNQRLGHSTDRLSESFLSPKP